MCSVYITPNGVERIVQKGYKDYSKNLTKYFENFNVGVAAKHNTYQYITPHHINNITFRSK